jgi:hypothetical protein
MRFAIPRAVHARLVERLIFNFRLRPEALAHHLPATWLQPQVFNGWSVVSFCILDLERVMLSPLPGFLGYRTPLKATVDYDWLDGAWSDAGVVLDSAVRASGGGR